MEEVREESEQEARLTQANKLFQTGVMLIYGRRKSVDKAIKCVQKAITLNDTDYRFWQLLGEAYYQRGSLNPSINCFMKSLSLAEELLRGQKDDWQEGKQIQTNCIHSRLRMSDIRLSVMHLDEAMMGYKDIIANDPENAAALIGLSRAELQIARNYFSSGLVQSGHMSCVNALSYALRAAKLSPHLCLTWKLASDCCLIQFVYGQRGQFSTKLDIQFPGGNQDGLLLDRLTCIGLAQQFLCKALAIEPFQTSGCLWHNLGIGLYLEATMFKEQPLKRQQLLNRSLKCLIKALNCDRKSSQIRNSIGVVAFNLNYRNTAKSFLIKSIQTNMSTSEIQFSNLGYIYLHEGEHRIASVAFSRCQAEEPLYCRSWLGSAIMLEQKNLDNLSFLRHCHKLENNYESQVMYATKVTSLPLAEEYQKDLVNALDCMRRIVNYNHNALEAKNTLGLLYERCKYQEQARLCFEESHELAPNNSKIVFNKLRQNKTEGAGCQVNLETQCTMQSEAKFIKVAEKLAANGNCEYMLNFVYYLFMNNDYKNINSKMTRIIEKLRPDDLGNKIGAQILLALTAKAEGDDFKSWLFKNIIDSENLLCVETLVNLFSLMLLGSTTGDRSLVDQIAKDLSKYLISYLSSKSAQFADHFGSKEGFWTRITLFSSIFCLKDQTKMIRPLVALYPTVAELWLYLGLALMIQKARHQTAIFCIKKANLIGSTDPDLCLVCDILLAILCQRTRGKPFGLRECSSYLSQAIFKNPSYWLLWETLIHLRDRELRKETKKDQTWSKRETSLFSLAIDHVLIKIVL